MLVKSYIPSGMLFLAGVNHCCLMYTHAPSTFSSIIPLSKPSSHAHFPQAPCWPALFIEYIFYSATFFHLSWQLQLLWGGAAHEATERRGPLHFHCTHHAPANEGPSRLEWTNREDDLDFFFSFLFFFLFILFKKGAIAAFGIVSSWKNNKKSIEGHQLGGHRIEVWKGK